MSVIHGFGNRASQVVPEFAGDFDSARPQWKQVHQTAVVEVLSAGQSCGETDGLYTESLAPIHVVTADCVPLLLERRDGGAVAALHAGWRGVFAHYPRVFAEFLKTKNDSPVNWRIRLGPSIQKCCFEVREDLLAQFVNEFPRMPRDVLSPTHRHIDLHAVLRFECAELGIELIEDSLDCTKCTRDGQGNFKYFSYRREGTGVRQYSSIRRA